MMDHPFRNVLLAGLVMVAGLFASVAQASEIVVIESTAPGVEAGVFLDSADAVSIPAGASILIVEADGSTRTVEGPFDGPLGAAAAPDADSAGLMANLGKLISEREEEEQVLGAIRTAPGQVAEAVYVVDVGRSGDVCVPEGAAIRLWRPVLMAAESETTLTGAAGEPVTALWLEGEQFLDWPVALPAEDGERYAIRLAIAPRPAEVRLRFVPASLETDTRRAAWMAGAGCRRQAERLLQGLAG